ncbi:hypothetical protein QTP88_024200 [Uroleucon formosanum]
MEGRAVYVALLLYVNIAGRIILLRWQTSDERRYIVLLLLYLYRRTRVFCAVYAPRITYLRVIHAYNIIMYLPFRLV